MEETYTMAEAMLRKRRLLIPLPLALFSLSIALTLCFFHIFTGVFGQVEPFRQRLFCLTLLLLLCFTHFPLTGKSWNTELRWVSVIDFLLMALSLFCLIYPLYDFDKFQWRMESPTPWDIFWGTSIILLVLEASRRVIGWIMIIISVLVVVVGLFGEYLPAFLYGPSIPWSFMVQVIAMQDWGIFGIPLGVVTDYLILFMVFVAFMTETGAANIFVNLSMAFVGGWSGGPAKAAVIASGLLGTLSGSAVGNVAATGSFTIPLMKRMGYDPPYAGGVEACASTGGQIVPPIMGAAAFLMAEFMGISYWSVVLAAIIPAFVYYTGIFSSVHFKAVKLGLKGLPPSERPRLLEALKPSYIVLTPILLLIVVLSRGLPLPLAASSALAAVVVLSMVRRETRLTPSKIMVALDKGATSSITVGVICAAAGIIIGGFYVTGFQNQLINLVTKLSGGSLLAALLITAPVCILLGMAVTTTVVYVLVYIFAIPTLIKLGADPLAAHFFCFWYGVVAPITPPVGLAFYTAASIAKCKPMHCGFSAARLAITAYILPFALVLSPALVLDGTPFEIAIALSSAGLAAICLAAGLEGWLRRKVFWVSRAFLVSGGVVLFYPELWYKMVGLVLVGVPLLWNCLKPIPSTEELT
jgi:TRAP transporter 4TM/12TM fusion protein